MLDLTDSETRVRATAERLAQDQFRPRAAEIDEEERYPWENVAALQADGLMGLTVPRVLGGPGLPLACAVSAVREIAKACAVTARIVVESNMGAVGAIIAYGSKAQQQLAAQAVLNGDKPAICITEPGAGSAATEMTTTAKRVEGGWRLDGKKHWITGGGVSRLHLIFARMVEHGRDLGIGAFIAHLGDRGLGIGQREPTMGLRGIPETEVLLDGLFVADSMALVPEEDPARGFKRLMTAYNAQRVGAAAVALGIAEGAYTEARTYLQTRHQFGRPLAEFQGLQWMLADMSIAIEAAGALVMQAARSAEETATGFPDQAAAARAKIFAAETAVKVTNDALQMHGAAGYSRRNPVERMVRDARMFTIGGGTAQVLRNQVASHELGMKLPQTRDGYARQATTAM
ncbi:MAG: acyl-CoA dehydrogenase family protein [Pseudomonadota bacterium]